MFTPVIDISVHQADVDFGLMRSRGVEGVIIRAAHADDIDDRLEQHVAGAIAGGFAENDIGFYGFVNPKRASGHEAAQAVVNAITRVLGHTRTFYMVDIEHYGGEPPRPGEAPVFGAAMGTYIREHVRALHELAPDMHVLGYANKNYWNGPVPGQRGVSWIGDAQLANELDWIVPRYHVQPGAALRTAYSDATNKQQRLAALEQLRRWQSQNAPPDPDGWGQWALTVRRNVSSPHPPDGAGWAGWQFSADWNGQGVRYGCRPGPADRRDPDLDLNIVRTEAWNRWTNRTVSINRLMSAVLLPGPDTLVTDQGLAPGEQRISKNGAVSLMHQPDGDVVVRRGNTVLFATGTAGSRSAALVMQTDGNLVLYDDAGRAVWHTHTHGNPGAGLRVENDGRVVVYSPAMRPLWTSDTMPDTTPDEPADVTVPGRRTVVVRPGDGWIKIAKRELGSGGRWRELARLNGGETRVLHPGDVIVLPA